MTNTLERTRLNRLLAAARRLKSVVDETDPRNAEAFLNDDAWEQRWWEARNEIATLRGDMTFQLGLRLRRSLVWRALRWLRTGNRNIVELRALDSAHPSAKGREVWLLDVRWSERGLSLPWDLLDPIGNGWTQHLDASSPYGRLVRTQGGGRILVPVPGAGAQLALMKHPWSGRVEVRYRGDRVVLDLYSSESGRILVRTTDRGVQIENEAPRDAPAPLVREGDLEPVGNGAARSRRTVTQREWLESIARIRPRCIAVHVPRWLGVSASTRQLFETTHAFPATPDVEPYDLPQSAVEDEADLLLETGVCHFVLSGGDEVYQRLADALRRRRSDVRCDLFWHGGFTQFGEAYAWNLIRGWIERAQSGRVHAIATAKKGMDEFFRELGCRSFCLLNYVREIPAGASIPDRGNPHIGIWTSGQSFGKNVETMVSAVRMVEGAVLSSANLGQRAREIVDFTGTPTGFWSNEPIPRDELFARMRSTHLTLYVTYSECCPMLPLESFSVGVPCLIGPSSHLFEDDAFLSEHLIVRYPDRAEVIARQAARVIAARDALVDAYARYAIGYNETAKASVERFLNG